VTGSDLHAPPNNALNRTRKQRRCAAVCAPVSADRWAAPEG